MSARCFGFIDKAAGGGLVVGVVAKELTFFSESTGERSGRCLFGSQAADPNRRTDQRRGDECKTIG